MREYRIYLPLKYNDGTAIEEEKFREIKTDHVRRNHGKFALSTLPGQMEYGGVEYVDDIITIEIVASDDRAKKRFFKDSKNDSKKIFSKSIF